jgi:hypothetical protein
MTDIYVLTGKPKLSEIVRSTQNLEESAERNITLKLTAKLRRQKQPL